MNVTVTAAVSNWMTNRSSADKNIYNTKCAEAQGNDLSTWRNVGQGNYDCRLGGDLRLVAIKTGGATAAAGDNFTVSAVYRHASNGGKTKVIGSTVANY
jgi:hypothetical protein